MTDKSNKFDRIILWLIITGGLVALLLYGLSSFLVKPTVETITTHAPNTNQNDGYQNVNYENRKPK